MIKLCDTKENYVVFKLEMIILNIIFIAKIIFITKDHVVEII